MRACHYHRHFMNKVTVGEIPRPKVSDLREGQLIVKVHAASLNPADWKSANGEQAALLSFAWPRTYGFDFSGEVVGVFSGGSSSGREYVIGDEVFGMIQGLPQYHRGTVAEYVIVEAEVCARKPSNISHTDAASVPLVAITAVKMLDACNLQRFPKLSSSSPPRVLITGGAGGMGTILIQLAKQMYGSNYVVTTASAGAKTKLCASLGATRVVNYRAEKLERALASENNEDLFDAILDCTGEAKKCVPLLKEGGGMCSILAGAQVEAVVTWLREAKLDPMTVTSGVRPFLMSSFGGTVMNFFTGASSLKRSCARRGATFRHIIGTGNGKIMAIIADLMSSGKIRSVIDSVYPLNEAVTAITHQKAGHAAGKVVVEIIPERKL